MSGATHPDAGTGVRAGHDDADGPVAQVSDALKLFARAVRAHQLYLPNNPMHARALEGVHAGFAELWKHADDVSLVVTDTSFEYDGHAVLEEPSRGAESLPWLFYKDGVRALRMRAGFENGDLDVLLDVVRRVRARTDEEDLVALLWECEFANFAYEYVEVGDGGGGGLGVESGPAPGAALLAPRLEPGAIEAPGVLERGAVSYAAGGDVAEGAYVAQAGAVAGGEAAAAAPSPFARIDDFDSTLYFLDEREIVELQRAIREDFARDLRPPVISALLDTLELERDPTVREEICGILDTFLLTLLANREFRGAAYLLRESAVAADRAEGLSGAHRERLLALRSQLSDADVLSQLMEALEDVPLTSPQPDLHELLTLIGPTGLETVFRYVVRTQNAGLRALLEEVATRIAAANTAELTRLIGSTDATVVLEAMRRAAAVGSVAAVGALSRALSDPDVAIRRGAVAALAAIGSAGAMQAIERAVEDDDRDVRIAAVRTVAERQHRAGLPRVDRVLRERVLRDGTTTAEKGAFFDAYATLAGESGVPFLDALLNPKGFLSRKGDPQARAAAATALGKIGTPAALDALRKATDDGDVIVRTAAGRALRGGA